MRTIRILVGVLTGLFGLAMLILTGGLTGTGLRGYEGWWIFPPIGLPLVGLFFATTWALWAGRRVRPVIGRWLLLAALTWSALFRILFYIVLQGLMHSNDPILVLLLLWPLIVLAVLLSWPLLWRQGVSWAPFALLGITVIWIAAWAHFWAHLLWTSLQRFMQEYRRILERSSGMPPSEDFRFDPVGEWLSTITQPSARLIDAFFLVPAALALIAGLTLALARPRR